ncbi:hypothetical protein GCM10027176_23640 [Actinoallomurus bryophytorum]|nr:hypothetical protein [Actinoallomurus bryophytorum]
MLLRRVDERRRLRLAPAESVTCSHACRALKNQLGIERHNARTTEGLWARTSQRILALNTAIWHNWLIDAPIKRSLTAYDH